MKRNITYPECIRAASNLVRKLSEHTFKTVAEMGVVLLYAVPRGGVPAALLMINTSLQMGSPVKLRLVGDSEAHLAHIVFDDLIDSGATKNRMTEINPHAVFATLFSKRGPETGLLFGSALPSDEWAVFPWEGSEEASAEDIPRRLLQYIGEDPERGGLKETPGRFLRAWKEWTNGYKIEPADVLKTFEDGAEDYDEMVLVKDIPVYSHCEHHLAPFFGVAHVAYIPSKKIVGLSKLSRLVDVFAHRLQVQERLTTQIADALNDALEPRGVGVVIECRHMCIESRGIRRHGSAAVTSAMRGAMMEKPEARAELISLMKGGRVHG